MCVPTVESGLSHHLYNDVQAEGLFRTHRPMSPKAEYLNDMCEGTSVNVDLARFSDSQETLLDVVHICCFSSPFESAFGNGRAIESGISGSQL